MRNLTRWSKTTLVASVTVLGLSAASLSDAAVQSQSVSPTGSAEKSANAKKSAIVPVRVVARRSQDQLVPRLDAASGFSRLGKASSDQAVIAFRVMGAPLRFSSLPNASQRELLSKYGKDAAKQYEAGVAQQLKDLVNRARADYPAARVGVIGMPFSPTDKSVATSNANYANLIASVDVLLPTGRSSRSAEAMKALADVAKGRQIVPVTGNTPGRRNSNVANRDSKERSDTSSGTVDISNGGSRGSNGDDRSDRRSVSLSGDSGSSDSNGSVEGGVADQLQSMEEQDAVSALVAAWGTSNPTWDINGDGIVDGFDLSLVLAHYDEYGNDDDDPDDNHGGGNGGGNDGGSGGGNDGGSGGGNDGGSGGGNDGGSGGGNDGGAGGNDGDSGGGNDGGSGGGNDGGGSQGGDIQTLVPGSGFIGATQQPGVQNNAQCPGRQAKAIARWTELPYITRDSDFYVTVSAYHMCDIDRVEFILDGGEPVICYDVQPHPDTGYAEYIVKVDVSGLAPGKHEIRAIAYPHVGIPRVLQGETVDAEVWIVNNGNESFWFNYDPNPRTVTVGPNGQYDTIDDALNAEGQALYAGRIYLSEGTHDFLATSHLDFRNTEEDLVLTVSAAPGADPNSVFVEGYSGPSDGLLRYGSIHVRNVSVISTTVEGYSPSFAGRGANRLMLEGIRNTSDDPDFGWGDLGIQSLAQGPGHWQKGLWMKDCTFVNVPKGPNAVMLAKNVSFTRMSADAFGSGPGAVINCWLDKADQPGASHQQHPDIIQVSITSELTAVLENRIFADIRATNNTNQIGHISGPEYNHYENFAFVRWNIDSMYSSSSLNFAKQLNHVVVDDCTFRNCAISFGPRGLKHFMIRDTLMRKWRGLGKTLGFDGCFDVPTMNMVSVHFEENPFDFPGSTWGEVGFAAPSAPVGTPSNGSNGYIPSYVMSDAEFTNQFLGNPDVEKFGQVRDHFYYDKDLLDLSWWRVD